MLESKDEPERPSVLVEYHKSEASEAYIIEILEFLADMEIFNVFAEADEKLPLFKPRIRIVDKAEQKMLKRNPVKNLDPIHKNNNYYFKQYIEDDVYLGEGVTQSVENFVNSFVDGRLKHTYFSEQRAFESNVKQIMSN
jgi:hypothetical protein